MLEFIPFNNIGSKQWDDFCLRSDDAWFRHSSSLLKFCLSLNNLNKNLSFGIIEEGRLLAIAPLNKQPIAGEDDLFEFAMGGDPTPFPALGNNISDSQSAKLVKSIFTKIDELAKTNAVVYSKFFIDPLSESFVGNPQNDNPLLKFGFNNVSLTVNIVNLSLPEKKLFQNIRDTYRYDIRLAAKLNLSVDFFDKNNINDEIFKIYKDIYFSSAGKEVGTAERWDATHTLIKQGDSVLAAEKSENGQYISGVLYFTYKNNAYYAFGATIPEFKKVSGISHFLQWEIIKYLKKYNFNYYNLGWNFYPIISDEVYSAKEINISFFKSGFGGKIYPLIRGEKFYSAEYLKKRKNNLSEKYTEYFMKE